MLVSWFSAFDFLLVEVSADLLFGAANGNRHCRRSSGKAVHLAVHPMCTQSRESAFYISSTTCFSPLTQVVAHLEHIAESNNQTGAPTTLRPYPGCFRKRRVVRPNHKWGCPVLAPLGRELTHRTAPSFESYPQGFAFPRRPVRLNFNRTLSARCVMAVT